MSKVDVTQYLAALAQEAGLDEAVRTAVLQAAANEKFAKKLGDELMTRPDYSRNMDDLAKQKEAFEKQKSEWAKFYEDTVAYDKRRQEALDRYEATFGKLEDDGVERKSPVTGDHISRKEFEEAMNRQSSATLSLLEDVASIQGEHFQTFGKPLTRKEITELKELAIKGNKSLADTYRGYIEPNLSEKRNMETEARIKQAREEGLREGLSKAQVPIDTAPREPHPFFDRKSATEKPDARAAFVSAWNEAAAKP